jgi:hypothetical protein
MTAVSACVTPPAVTVAVTTVPSPEESARTRPVGLTCTYTGFVEAKTTDADSGSAVPKAERGVAVNWIVSYGAAVESVTAR